MYNNGAQNQIILNDFLTTLKADFEACNYAVLFSDDKTLLVENTYLSDIDYTADHQFNFLIKIVPLVVEADELQSMYVRMYAGSPSQFLVVTDDDGTRVEATPESELGATIEPNFTQSSKPFKFNYRSFEPERRYNYYFFCTGRGFGVSLTNDYSVETTDNSEFSDRLAVVIQRPAFLDGTLEISDKKPLLILTNAYNHPDGVRRNMNYPNDYNSENQTGSYRSYRSPRTNYDLIGAYGILREKDIYSRTPFKFLTQDSPDFSKMFAGRPKAHTDNGIAVYYPRSVNTPRFTYLGTIDMIRVAYGNVAPTGTVITDTTYSKDYISVCPLDLNDPYGLQLLFLHSE